MKLIKITLIAVLLALLSCNFLWARTTSSDEAEMVVTGWVKGHPQPLGMTLGRDVTRAETFMNDEGQPAYHIVYLRPTGFVIVSADDLVEPIIGFVNGSTYDPSPENPLGALVSRDLNGRIEAARNAFQTLGTTIQTVETKTQNKWKYFSDLAEKPDNEFKLLSDEPYGRGCLINDIWVAPFVQSKWNQGSIPGDSLMYCYNYYTPNHYPSGCVATAMAQLMYYYQYPDEPYDQFPKLQNKRVFTIKVDDQEKEVYLKGGDGSGGPYKWDRMEDEPSYLSSVLCRQAIGAICFDAGVSVGMEYTSGGSWIPTSWKAADALKDVFYYSNAVKGYIPNTNSMPGIIGMINPNLDAKKPVILGILGVDLRDNKDIGHAIVCDGYGYDSSSLYHHLNMGFSGQADCWYNLPNIDCSDYSEVPFNFTDVIECVYNIFKSGTGEIISGRVLYNSGEPVENVYVYCSSSNEEEPYVVSTDSNGIFFFDQLVPDTTYTITVPSTESPLERPDITLNSPQEIVQIRTGNSRDYGPTAGNVWGVIFGGKRELYVDDNAANDPGPDNPNIPDPHEDGSSEHPFDAIQEAIDEAMPGDIITIRPGTYRGTSNRDLDFKGKPITVRGLSAAQTIIDCQGTQSNPHRGFIFQSGEKTVSVLKDLTITGGYPYDRYIDFNGNPYYCGLGGGIYCINDSSPKIVNCIIRSNQAKNGNGGGIYCQGSNPTIVNCIFVANLALIGGGMCNISSNPIMINCNLINNEAFLSGGGVFNQDSNTELFNCIVWGNKGTQFGASSGGSIVANFSNIQGGGLGGQGNINVDPLFADADGDDNIVGTIDDNLRLQAGSPCINSGSNVAVPTDIETDLAGNPRINNGVVDMGAYEF